MPRFCITATIFLLFCGSTVVADVVYQLMDYPSNQNGHSLSGMIATIDSASDDGLLLPEEILSWQVDISGANGFSHSSADGGTVSITGNILITDTEISLDHIENEINTIEFLTSDYNEVLRYLRISDIFNAGAFDHYSANPAWEDNDPLLNGGNGTWVLASSDPLMDANIASWAQSEPGIFDIFSFSELSTGLAPVPEPASIRLLLVAFVAMTVLRRQRQ